MKKHAGVLLHISSLPSKYGIGDLGKDAFNFIDYLKKSKISLWQMLPLGPTGYGNSPYSSLSAFAVNPILISPESLYEDGLLSKEELEKLEVKEERRVNFNKVIENKFPILKLAASRFKEDKDYKAFLKRNDYLKDYALFSLLASKFNDNRWYIWPSQFRDRNSKETLNYEKNHDKELKEICIIQYFFEKQFKKLKLYAKENKISIIGDIPIFVAKESVDTWVNLELFKTRKDGSFKKVAGVPPDESLLDGQLWGNPIYNWKRMQEDNFSWWIKRMKRLLDFSDIIRVDHFRGFASCYEIDSKEKTARNGKWVKAPGEKLLKAMYSNIKNLNILVEDLGYMTKEVEDLRNSFNLPSMRLALLGFNFLEDDKLDLTNSFLPHNYPVNCCSYTGTHDNCTSLAFLNSLSPKKKESILSYLKANDNNFTSLLIEKLYASKAKYVIIPMQDILNQDDDARMNTPSTCNEINWSYKILSSDLKDEDINFLANLSDNYNRK